jgi:thiol-disulfide isomerase/thioredoxin
MIRYVRTFQLVLATASVATASLAATTFLPDDLATATGAPIVEQMASQKALPQHPMKNNAMQKEAMPAPMMNDFKPFTAEAFKSAAQAGKTTLVFFHAPWCPVCKAQEPKVLAHLNGAHKDIVAFKIDYDTNPGLRKEMKVDKQSTLILYQGATEVARLSYKSDTPSIDELFSHASMAMPDAK